MAIGKRYKDFFAEVHLSPEQQQRFGTLVINRDNAGGEVREAARLKGIDISEGPLLEQTVTEISSGVTNNLRELLGATGYTKLMEFERTAFLRVTSGSLNAKSPAAP